MITPSVSLGLPVYNGEAYLAKCLDALLAQTYTDFELIISDNCSTDKTESICREYAKRDTRIAYYRQKTNLGAAGNFQKVFTLSKGKYFKWVAYDDLHAPQFLERCVNILDTKPEVILCFGDTMIIDAQGKETEMYHDKLHLDSPFPSERFKHFLAELGLCNAMFGLIRKEPLGKTPLIAKFVASDVILLAELSMRGQFYFVRETLFYRRLHAQASGPAHPTLSSLAAWYDPKHNGKLTLPTWTHFRKYLGAIRRVPMSILEKSKCLKILLIWVYYEFQNLKQESQFAFFWFWRQKIKLAKK